ncbi:MAG: hypothetical protein FWG89_07825 [Treponema sp.]|nr:hypothetical protein [Treponema sp.]
MKKIIALCIIAILCCGVVLTAQEETTGEYTPIQFSAYARALWAPLVYRGRAIREDLSNKDVDGPGYGVGGGPGWENNISAAVGLRIFGNDPSGNIGFDLSLRAVPPNRSASSTSHWIDGIDRNAHIWARPFLSNALRIQFGMFQWNEMEGRIGGVGDVAGGYGGGEGDIFRGVHSADALGALFVIKPEYFGISALQGLTLFTSFGVSGGIDGLTDWKGRDFSAQAKEALEVVYSTPHVGIGYENDAFGFARAQFIASNYHWGKGLDDRDEYARMLYYPWYGTTEQTLFWLPAQAREAHVIQAAVNLTMLSHMGINLDIGVGIPFSREVVMRGVTPMGVGPKWEERGNRSQIGSFVERDNLMAGSPGDVWQPAYNIALGADWTPEGSDFGLRFRTRMEFGEQFAFAESEEHNKNDRYRTGLIFELGLEPRYTFVNVGTVALALGLKVETKDEYNNSKTFASPLDPTRHLIITRTLSAEHKSRIDLGLGAFFTRPFSAGNFIKVGIAANLPLGGDRYTWSDDDLPIIGAETFWTNTTEAYKKLNTYFSVPIILELNL